LEVDAEAMAPADVARLQRCDCSSNALATLNLTFVSPSSNVPTVAAICRRLDALPLALELAAPWIKVLPPRICSTASRTMSCSRPPARAIFPNASKR
jgi:hypothetical protein